MKKHLNELTEGMQRLCAVANRVVQQQGTVERIELDLMMEELRRLYGVVLLMGGEGQPQPMAPSVPSEKLAEPSPVEMHDEEPEPKAEEKMMAMMSTLAAMQPESVEDKTKDVKNEAKDVKIETEDSHVSPVTTHVEETRLPQMEELEQSDNALLFDEVIVEPEESLESETRDVKSEPMDVENKATEDVLVTPITSPVEEEPSMKPSQQASLMDFLNQPAQRTLGESLGADRPQPSSLEKKVDDLRTVININDKFSFMSELFHNNMKAYNDFIMSLNAIVGRDEALAFVQEAATQQKWDEASPTVQAFYRVFDKKF